MNKFQVGDRVNVYEPVNEEDIENGIMPGLAVTILEVKGDLIKTDFWDTWFHYKTCRKLKPKKRRSVWVDFGHRFPYHSGTFKYDCCDYPIEGWTEFKEVVKK